MNREVKKWIDDIANDHTIEITSAITIKSIVITKQIKASDIVFKNGNPIFVFKLAGSDVFGTHHTYYGSVEFTKSYVKANTDDNGNVEASYTFDNLYCGDYVATEMDTARYKFKNAQNYFVDEDSDLDYVTTQGEQINFFFTDRGLHRNVGYGTFVNQKYEWQYYSHTHRVVNEW